MRTVVGLPILMICAILSGCQGNQQITPPHLAETEIPLQGVTWRFISFESGNGAITPLPDAEAFVITFNPDTSFDGHTSVNSYSGTYVSDGNLKTVEIGKIISTLADGGPNETKFYNALRQSVRYRATSEGRVKRLKLFYGADNEALNFVGS
jgi:heat shock protein HslJ